MDTATTVNLTMLEPSWLVPLARDAEELGFDAVSIGDSLFYPRHSDTLYPYTDTGDRSFIEGRPFLDPFVAGAAIVTATTSLKFQPSVLKLGVRHPVLVAKQAASLDALAPGRLRLGVGSSPWPEDYSVMGVDHERRGARFEESIVVVRRLLQSGYQSHDGAFYEFPDMRIDPAPSRPIPLIIGGHGPATLRRAATLGSGWIAASGDRSRVAEMIDQIAVHRREAGLADEAFSIHAPLREDPDSVGELISIGVTNVVVRPDLAGGDMTDLTGARSCLRATAAALT